MKENILVKTNIDIDSGIKPEMVNKIKAHYANKLGMTTEEIALQFPAPRIIEESRTYNNQRYLVENQSKYPTTNYFPNDPRLYQNNFTYQNFGHQNYVPYQNTDQIMESMRPEDPLTE